MLEIGGLDGRLFVLDAHIAEVGAGKALRKGCILLADDFDENLVCRFLLLGPLFFSIVIITAPIMAASMIKYIR